MNNLQKLTEFLCSEEDIRKDIEIIANWVNPRDSFDIDECWGKEYYNLEERHLRMYCERKEMYLEIYKWELSIMNNTCMETLIKVDWYNDTKPFHQQSEEKLGAIVAFLESNIEVWTIQENK